VNNREKMRLSNKKAVEFLLRKGYRDIILRTHCKHKDYVYNNVKKYRCTDYWNLFDGMGYDRDGNLFFLQIKTNAWASRKLIEDFLAWHKGYAILINVQTLKSKRAVVGMRKIG